MIFNHKVTQSLLSIDTNATNPARSSKPPNFFDFAVKNPPQPHAADLARTNPVRIVRGSNEHF
jgi:hypothetical protein